MSIQSQGVEELELRFAARMDELDDALDLVALLDERHPDYENQPPPAVARLRGWLLVCLSRKWIPEQALPYLLEELETAHDPYLLAAAARALRAYPKPSSAFVPAISRALKQAKGLDAPVHFDSYGQDSARNETSSPMRELIDTVGWLGPLAKPIAGDLLELKVSGAVPVRLMGDLDGLIGKLNTTGGESCCDVLPASFLGIFSWEPQRRKAARLVENLVLEDQDGVCSTYRQLFYGHPTVVVFFYTRCDNPLKCSLSLWKLGLVQKILEERGVATQIHTAAISYDSVFDTPHRLNQYGVNRRVKMDSHNRLLRAVDDVAALRHHFELGVSFYESIVNRHRIEVFVLDREARIATSFQRLSWQENAVADAAIALIGSKRQAPNLSSLGLTTGVVAALIPKCPVCWAAYLSAVGIGGLSTTMTSPLIWGGCILLLLIHIASIYWRVRKSRLRIPVYALLFGGVAAVVAHLGFGVNYAAHVGAALLLTSSVLSVNLEPSAD